MNYRTIKFCEEKSSLGKVKMCDHCYYRAGTAKCDDKVHYKPAK